jgi:hypothetical protein
MKQQYIIQNAIIEDERPLLEGKTVYEREPEDTGIISKDGNKIYRARRPIGFVEPRE